MATLRIHAIKCIEQEDHWGDDDAYIVVNGKHVWKSKMDDGQTREVNVKVSFASEAHIVLWEADSMDPDDKLGEHRLTSRDTGERILNFKDDDGVYEMWISVA